MSVDSSRSRVATGETGKYPKVHVWNIKKLEPDYII